MVAREKRLKPVILAGGLTPENVEEAIARLPVGRRYGLRGESSPGRKDRLTHENVHQGGSSLTISSQPDAGGHFGPDGGRYVPKARCLRSKNSSTPTTRPGATPLSTPS